MTDCSTELQALDDKVLAGTCLFHISQENDPDNWWYSPFSAAGISGAYSLVDPSTNESKGRAGFISSQVTGLQCLPGAASVKWNDNADPGMCIRVQGAGNDQNVLGPEWTAQDVGPTTSDACTADDSRWITDATAFAPAPGAVHTGPTNYEMRGCELDCTQPDDLVERGMEELDDGSKSFNSFTKHIRCIDGKHAPLVNPNGSPVNNPDIYSSSGVVPIKCRDPGQDYSLGGTSGAASRRIQCSDSCIMPSSATEYPGYDLTQWAAAIQGNSQANARNGIDHWDEDAIGNLAVCQSGYSKIGDNSFVAACYMPGAVVNIASEAGPDTGCIASCVPDPNSQGLVWNPTRAAAADSYTGGVAEIPWNSEGPGSLSCSARFELGPGAIQDQGGTNHHLIPKYEGCGKLAGHETDPSSDFYKATRKNYAVTGCYPECDASTDICLNYTAERSIDLSVGPILDSAVESGRWRTEMGSQLNGADGRLSLDNISFVRRQVLNNDVTATTEGREIFEWQVKCPTDTCSLRDDGDKLNLTSLLGPDGIPPAAAAGTGAAAPPGNWFLQATDGSDAGASCLATCHAQDQTCTDGDWGVSDEESFRSAMLAAGGDPDICLSYGQSGAGYFPAFHKTLNRCMYQSGAQSTCDDRSNAAARLCRCTGTDGAAPTTPTAPTANTPPGNWVFQDPEDGDGTNCNDTCSNAGYSCSDGDWGVTDEASFQGALIAAGGDDAICDRFISSVSEFYPAFTNGGCVYNPTNSTTCHHNSANVHRLCKCD